MNSLNVLSLFAGIGGLDLGLERAGMRVVGQVEIDPYCCDVLEQHWPEVPRHHDVRTAIDWWRGCHCQNRNSAVPRVHQSGACRIRRRPTVHVVAGGFPCPPFSGAGPQLGVADPRWGWPWFARVVRDLRPSYVVVENVANLLRHAEAFEEMLGDLAVLGFDADWCVLSACSVGASHPRRRLFLVAYPNGTRLQGLHEAGRHLNLQSTTRPLWWDWPSEPEVARVADGIPRRLVKDEIQALGNAVVPQVAEYVGSLIVAHASSVVS